MRLKLKRKEQNYRRFKRFNSILVRLKSISDLSLKFSSTVFQFHIGAIKIKRDTAKPSGRKSFQFHIGAIKIPFSTYMNASIVMFQFHIGAIKINSKALTAINKISFNSILVRLKCA